MKKTLLVLSVLVGASLSLPAQAKSLFGRMGLGYNAQFANTETAHGVPAVSLKYGLSARSMIEMVAGYYSGTNGSGVAALKYLQTIHPENYVNFYFLLGAGRVSANSKTGTEFLGGFGTEFFIPGVDSVGISFETGVSVENLSSLTDSFVIKTFGVSFINAGMHFYF